MGEINLVAFYVILAASAVFAFVTFIYGPRWFRKALRKIDEREQGSENPPPSDPKKKDPPKRMWDGNDE